VLYQTPVLKMMNILVFADSFLLIFVGVGMNGSQGIAFGVIYGILGGITAAMMFNVAVIALIMMSSREKRPQASAKKPAGH
jgi:predicted tellurium resistance membrane protein TerC